MPSEMLCLFSTFTLSLVSAWLVGKIRKTRKSRVVVGIVYTMLLCDFYWSRYVRVRLRSVLFYTSTGGVILRRQQVLDAPWSPWSHHLWRCNLMVQITATRWSCCQPSSAKSSLLAQKSSLLTTLSVQWLRTIGCISPSRCTTSTKRH